MKKTTSGFHASVLTAALGHQEFLARVEICYPGQKCLLAIFCDANLIHVELGLGGIWFGDDSGRSPPRSQLPWRISWSFSIETVLLTLLLTRGKTDLPRFPRCANYKSLRYVVLGGCAGQGDLPPLHAGLVHSPTHRRVPRLRRAHAYHPRHGMAGHLGSKFPACETSTLSATPFDRLKPWPRLAPPECIHPCCVCFECRI